MSLSLKYFDTVETQIDLILSHSPTSKRTQIFKVKFGLLLV